MISDRVSGLRVFDLVSMFEASTLCIGFFELEADLALGRSTLILDHQ
jgi:hypothetical protein